MSYDERAVAFTEKLERLIRHGAANVEGHRCGAILNALEVMVEEDAPPADPTAFQLLRRALLAQAAVAGIDMKRFSVLFDGLEAHVKAR
jgi:hypothetical protein